MLPCLQRPPASVPEDCRLQGNVDGVGQGGVGPGRGNQLIGNCQGFLGPFLGLLTGRKESEQELQPIRNLIDNFLNLRVRFGE